jgi:hypothetical protein
MNKSRFLIQQIFFVSLVFFSGCNPPLEESSAGYHIIDVSGPAMVLNYSRSTHEFGYPQISEFDTLSLVVSDGDLLLLMPPDLDIELLYRYNGNDGLSLSFAYDTANHLSKLNGEVISLDLSEGSRAWKWIAEHDDFTGIRSLSVNLPLPDGGLDLLGKVAKGNSNPGLYISGKGPVEELLKLFSPEWLFSEDFMIEEVTDITINNLAATELLFYSCVDSGRLDFLSNLPGLQSLILVDCQSGTIKSAPFEQLSNLTSFCLFESDIHDLSFLSLMPGLENLDLVACENLEEIVSISEVSNLRGLGFNDCNMIQDISSINDLPDLQRLALPEGISQSEFEAVLVAHPSIKILELLYCDNIEDLSPIKDLLQLEAITLGIDSVDLNIFKELKGLELLILKEEYFDDSLQIAALKRALPNTRVVPGGAFCMGSGWLILLFPMIFVVIVLKKWKKPIQSS